MTNILPERVQEKVRSLGESSYGATRVTVVLDDGTRIPDVYVAWEKEIVKVGGYQEVFFDAARVVDVEPYPR